MANNYIGKYRLVAELGTGTFGCVYKAQHQFLTSRIVAIKLMRDAPISSPQERDQFLQEALILEQLKHPYILPIIDVDVHEGSAYLVIEYAPNGSLKERINRQKDKPLPLEEAVTIISQVGQALQYAHQQNIIHRDLKPDNILFNTRGEAVLADFGIATLLASARTRQVGFGGTPAYMAPEQFEGKASMKSDQYALGCIAYELLTGHKPFAVPHPSLEAIWFQHAKVSPIAPRQINPNLPEHVESAILKAMAKQRIDRYADISAFVAALSISATSQAVLLSAKQKVLRLDVAQLTDVGRKREHNEDNMAFVIPKDSQVMANKGAFFIVADGGSVGGLAGEVASEIAVDTVANMYYQDDSNDVVVSLLHAISRANALIQHYDANNKSRNGMGTTCTTAVLRRNQAYIANVGNSRTYLIHRHQIRQITQDHSWVNEQIQAGLITEDQAHYHAQKTVITRCLGAQPKVDVDVFQEELCEGDSLILCTDGLSGFISAEELLRIVDQFVPQEGVYHLVEQANKNGGLDNITIIFVRVQEVGSVDSAV
jgi:serine/threonine protein kinase